ncbi:MAG: hypothetical protein WD334_08260 [Chitinophagales bacterium]
MNELNRFLELISYELEDVSIEDLSPAIDIKKLDQWNSINAVFILNMISEHYKIEISFEQLKATHSIEELFKLIQKNQKQS